MSGAVFHVHGPHDHELEQPAHPADKDSFAGMIAVKTAIIATIGALSACMGGATQAHAGLYKNNAAIKKTAADKLEAEAKEWDDKSDARMHLHHRWAQATTALQIAIALAAIALLTRRLEWGMFGVAAVGVALGGAALLHL
jgi:Na+/glutamate symporter